VDITFRVSGLFRDAFPTQMDIIGSAVSAIAMLEEPDEANPIAANVRAKTGWRSKADGMSGRGGATPGVVSCVRLESRAPMARGCRP